ncbi:MAG TPA: MFS transporter [Thermoplasmata archaeon]|nr:MFS transporter [Thermoplasmata archaeon]
MATGEPGTPAISRVFLTTALWSASLAEVAVPLPFQMERVGLSVFDYGALLGLFALGMLLTETYWGVVAVRLARARTLVLLGLVVVGATLLLGLATNFVEFAVAELLLGAVGVYLAPLLRLLAVTAGGPGTAASGTGRLGTFFGIGLILGTATGPLVFASAGFWVVALVSAGLLAVCLGVAVSIPWKRVALPESRDGIGASLRGVVTGRFTLVALLVFFDFLLTTFVTNFLQYYSVDLFGGTPAEAGYVLGAVRFTSLAVSFVLGATIDRWGPSRAAPLGFAALLGGILGTWWAPNFLAMTLASLVFGLGLGWLNATLLPLALSPVPAPQQGAAIGLFGSVEDLGLLVGPLVIGAVWSTTGVRSTFPLVALLGAVALALALLLARRDLFARKAGADEAIRPKPPARAATRGESVPMPTRRPGSSDHLP